MKTTIRTTAVSTLVLASLCGCGTVVTVASTATSAATSAAGGLVRLITPKSSAQPTPPSPTLDAYKTQVAQHVVQHNPSQTFTGKLPPMLPAIVVVEITVGKDGELNAVEVQRSRDPDASKVAVASIRRSEPLPKPVSLLANNSNSVKFSETFLFDSQYRFQLRSLAGPQTP